jgi:hypothetical protein
MFPGAEVKVRLSDSPPPPPPPRDAELDAAFDTPMEAEPGFGSEADEDDEDD